MSNKIECAPGCVIHSGYLRLNEQKKLLVTIQKILAKAPLFTPTMPRTGKAFSVRMSNMGQLGWVSDKERGYRYQDFHPKTEEKWPPIPQDLLDLWRDLTAYPAAPEACLVNYYHPQARMGLHRDEDEPNIEAPILSVSLGDHAKFRLGGLQRKGPTKTYSLQSGDVLVLGPPLRRAYHGIDRIIAGSSRLLEEGGRFNLTLRRVNPL